MTIFPLFQMDGVELLAERSQSDAPLIVDSFAGGGGASTGIEMALGRSPDIAINHNPAALALHAANHPQTLHLSENVYRVDPLDHLRGRHIGLMWFSPDCKHFSKAKGGKPVERNIRDLAWIIPGWIERVQNSGGTVDVVIMENVEEWKDWGPLVETDRGLFPCPDRKGQTFQKWCKAIRKLGGKIEWRELRACDFGAPTIRKRLFVIIRFDRKPIVWPEPTHGAPSDPDVIAGRKLLWRTAAECIDWSLPCPSIFDTSEEISIKYGLRAIRPLAVNTLARVARGMKRYVLDAQRPFLVQVGYGERPGQRPRAMDAETPLGTVVASGVKHAAVIPHLSSFYGDGAGGNVRSAPTDEPLRVVTTENRHAVIAPSIVRFNTGATGQDVCDPLSTITANSFIKRPGGAAPLGVVAPVLSYAQQGGGNRSAEDPLHTITASSKDQNCVATAFIAQHNNDSRRIGGVNPGRPVNEPLSTVTATGSQQSAMTAFIARQFGASTGHSVDEPSATITAGVNKSQLVTPFLQAYYGTGDGGEENQPARTITTKDRHGHVEAFVNVPPFTEDQIARARQVADFMRAHGFWDDREFVTLEISGITIVIVDIGMRMLTPRELYNAQGFPTNYEIERAADGTVFPKNVQVSCVGNSVSPPVAAALVKANCADLSAIPFQTEIVEELGRVAR